MRRSFRNPGASLAPFILLISSCGNLSQGPVSETLEDGSVRTRYERLAVHTLQPDTLWKWDPWSEREPYEFATIEQAITVGDRLMVTDSQAAQVVVVDPQGGERKPIGRRGSGPGEFLSPAYMSSTGGELWVSDMNQMRFSVFDDTGQSLREVAWPPGVSRLTGFTRDGAGRIYYRSYGIIDHPEDTSWKSLLRYRPSEGIVDTVLQVESEGMINLSLRMENGTRQTLGTYPLGVVVIHWDLADTPDGLSILTASEAGYRLVRRDPNGRRRRVLEVEGEGPDAGRLLDWWVTDGYYSEGPGTVLARMDMVPLDESLREWPVARYPQVVRGLRVDPAGRMWVLVQTVDPGVRRCDVFDPDLNYLGSLLPGRLPIGFLEDDTVVILLPSGEGESAYAGLRVELPVPAEGAARKIPD